jgi:hypothetical protein
VPGRIVSIPPTRRPGQPSIVLPWPKLAPTQANRACRLPDGGSDASEKLCGFFPVSTIA